MLGSVVELFSRISHSTAYIGYKRSETDGEQAIRDFMKSWESLSYGGTAPKFCIIGSTSKVCCSYPLLAAHLCMWEATGGNRQEALAPPAMELSNKTTTVLT